MSEAIADSQALSEHREPSGSLESTEPAGPADAAPAEPANGTARADSPPKRGAEDGAASDAKKPRLDSGSGDDGATVNGNDEHDGNAGDDKMDDDTHTNGDINGISESPGKPAEAGANGHAAEPAPNSDLGSEPVAEPVAEASAELSAEPKSEPETGGDAAPGEPDAESALTPLERATQAAERARIVMLPELDPPEDPPKGTGLPKHQHKYALSAIRAIKRLKDAAPFVAPVDPVKQGVPQYFEYIKQPMDLGTIEKRLVANEYDTVRALVSDFNLIVTNCIIFNGEDALISKMALSIAQSFKKQLSNMPVYDTARKSAHTVALEEEEQAAAAAAASTASAASAAAVTSASAASGTAALPPTNAADEHVGKRSSTTTAVVGPNGVPTLRRKSTIDGRPKREIRPPRHPGFVGSGTGEGRPKNKKHAAELRFAGQVVKEMQGRKLEGIAFPFLLPVDPVEQGVPNYFQIVKEPMDISTMQRKLNEGVYYTGDEFEADVRLMFRNCYSFNPEGTPVNVMGHKLEDWFDRRWLEKPVPGPAPSEDYDANDIDDEFADSGIQNTSVDFMEEQLRTVRKQLTMLKKALLAEHYKKGNRRGVVKRSSHPPRHASHSDAAHSRPIPTEMTYELKRDLKDRIEKLPEKKIRQVITIIQQSVPELAGQDEIEIELDALDQAVLLRLYKFAVLGLPDDPQSGPTGGDAPSEAGSPGGSAAAKKRKSKPLSEEEHNRQIAEIERKLTEFDQASGSPGASLAHSAAALHTAAGSAVDESDDSSDEPQEFGSDEDSSSEEE